MKKMGRPTTAKKDLCIKLRIDEETNNKLEVCMQLEKMNKSELIRRSILELYNKLLAEGKIE